MKERLKKVTTHLKKNKAAYIAGGITVVSVGVTAFVCGQRTSGTQIAQKINQIGFRNEANPVIVNLIERSTPSKPVHLKGTNQYFDSLSEAARQTGHSLTRISKNINGHIPDVNGDVFELLETAA